MEQDFDFDLQVQDSNNAGTIAPNFATTWICGAILTSAMNNCTGACPSANTRCTTFDVLC
ncbi:hypothetical protein [Deinococcus cellulosilyticus]|uniref:Lantibiotic n=1 Tax=Deinococcus cellulosilyticus (strain DSM 18568 / NBRC 106333 / KACC 11606 / 5516J-15) TaxID=1223518 RepID=A0A511NA26_DEIC1|nr:hypothetical protein [Deinococcus cellulosilyticus]GEM49376.1 hypothetical protein DC3_50110 [Deinococcus cellulosilyticus NBRC 106333 = KACC 11606]GEM49377.1 hypothetical protein DC3_50120 [Deinococcus cellulosilyticus NBRC 106333 = KACC 11606]